MLSKNIKKLRKDRNWSQQDLAVHAGLSFNAISNIEQGIAKNPRMETLIKFAEAFKITIDYLVGRKQCIH